MNRYLCSMVIFLCGCSTNLPTYPVEGRVEFRSGGPVHVGTIELKSREHNVQARGNIQSDGSFTLSTFEPGDGAVAGAHDCVIVQFVMGENIVGHKPSSIGVVDRRYASYSSSGLSLEIEPGKVNKVLLQVDGIRAAQPTEHEH